MSDPAFWADVVVGVHLAYAGYIVIAQILILLGLALGWQWIGNFWFRLIHLGMILYVAGEALLGVTCPLTLLERDLRRQAGGDAASFSGRLFHDILFLPLPSWSYQYLHIGFGVLVLLTFLFAPPRWPFRRSETLAQGG